MPLPYEKVNHKYCIPIYAQKIADIGMKLLELHNFWEVTKCGKKCVLMKCIVLSFDIIEFIINLIYLSYNYANTSKLII